MSQDLALKELKKARFAICNPEPIKRAYPPGPHAFFLLSNQNSRVCIFQSQCLCYSWISTFSIIAIQAFHQTFIRCTGCFHTLGSQLKPIWKRCIRQCKRRSTGNCSRIFILLICKSRAKSGSFICSSGKRGLPLHSSPGRWKQLVLDWT